MLVHLGRLLMSVKTRIRYSDQLSKMSSRSCILRSLFKLDLIPGTIISFTLICHAQVFLVRSKRHLFLASREGEAGSCSVVFDKTVLM